MSVAVALTIGGLYATGVFLILQRSLSRIVIGLAILGHGANLLLLAAGGRPGDVPVAGGDPSTTADPLPQALALTAIVITFGVTAFLLSLAYRSWQQRRDDEVEDDVEDRRIAALAQRNVDAQAAEQHESATTNSSPVTGDGDR